MSARASQVRTSAGRGRKPLVLLKRRDRRSVRRRGARGVAPVLIVGAILVAATVFGVLLAQVILGQSSFKMQQMRERIAEADEEHSRLVLKAAKLEAAERIERVAINRLGMVPPTQIEYIVADVPTGEGGRRDRDLPDALMPGGAVTALGGTSP